MRAMRTGFSDGHVMSCKVVDEIDGSEGACLGKAGAVDEVHEVHCFPRAEDERLDRLNAGPACKCFRLCEGKLWTEVLRSTDSRQVSVYKKGETRATQARFPGARSYDTRLAVVPSMLRVAHV